MYFLDSRNRIERLIQVFHLGMSETRICLTTILTPGKQIQYDDLTAGNNRDDMRDRQDSRYVSAGGINMSRNIDGISQGFT